MYYYYEDNKLTWVKAVILELKHSKAVKMAALPVMELMLKTQRAEDVCNGDKFNWVCDPVLPHFTSQPDLLVCNHPLKLIQWKAAMRAAVVGQDSQLTLIGNCDRLFHIVVSMSGTSPTLRSLIILHIDLLYFPLSSANAACFLFIASFSRCAAWYLIWHTPQMFSLLRLFADMTLERNRGMTDVWWTDH